MPTLKIKKVDFALLEKQRLLLNNVLDKLPDGPAKEAVRGVKNMLDKWSDERHKKSLGSDANQKAKAAQQDMFTSPHQQLKVCQNCGWEGVGNTCQECGSHALEPIQNVK